MKEIKQYEYWKIRSLIIIAIILSIIACSEKDDVTKPGNTDTLIDTITQVINFEIPATDELVFYEVNLRAFGPDCNLKSVLDQLDSIKALGVNVIWLMPIYPIGEINRVGTLGSPYSVQNYTEVNPELGTIDDLKKLVNEAHKKKMAVILDWVANHTAWDNPWIENKDWYLQDANGNIISPPGTNWADVAQLDFKNAEMRIAMINAMKYWIYQANIDGFRCDAADFVPFSFWKQAIDSLRKIPNKKLIMLAEGARSDHFTAGFDLNFSWDFYNKLLDIFGKGVDASSIFSTHNNEYATVPAGKHKLRFITNHDEYAWTNSPVIQYGSKDGSLAAFIATAFLSPVPLIYSGQEIAEENKIPFFSLYPLNWNKNYAIKAKYQRVMQLRESLNAIHKGSINTISHKNIIAFTKTLDTQKILVMVNCRNQQVDFTIPVSFKADSLTNLLTGTREKFADTFQFAPYEFMLFQY